MTCESGKIAFDSRDKAESNIKVIRSFRRDGSKLVPRRNGKRNLQMHSYKCPICNKWHLTSQKKK